MKKLFQKSGALIMAFLVLFSTMSFTVNKHFCGKTLVDQTVISEVKACCPAMHVTTSESGLDLKDSCCSDKKITIEGQDDLKLSFNSLDFHQQLFVATFVCSYRNLFENLPEQVVPFKDYSPPQLVYDLLLLDETFLI